MASLEHVRVHPIKSLDPVPVESATVVENGGLEWDRRYAIVDSDGNYVNGKGERRIHRVRSRFDLGRETVTLREHGSDDERTYDLEDDRAGVESWLSDFLGYSVELVRDDEGGFPDDTDASGPTVISTATVETVASWFDGIGVEGMRRRLRANLEIAGVEAFWEDRLYDEPGSTVPFEIGSVEFCGVNPCQRCVVPTRDPDTGDRTENFQRTFVERRRATLPGWAGEAWFDHYFRLMVNTRVPPDSWGAVLTVGDSVSLTDPDR